MHMPSVQSTTPFTERILSVGSPVAPVFVVSDVSLVLLLLQPTALSASVAVRRMPASVRPFMAPVLLRRAAIDQHIADPEGAGFSSGLLPRPPRATLGPRSVDSVSIAFFDFDGTLI